MPNERLSALFTDLEQTVKEFIIKNRVTHDEYRAVTEFIGRAVTEGEGFLLFDVFFENTSTDATYLDRPGTAESIEGPFYVPGAPWLNRPYVMPMRPDEPGDTLIFSGQVRSTDGEPLAGVELDLWQADARGMYSNVFPGVPDWNLRGRLLADELGRFEVRTVLPPPYEIKKDGPTGWLLQELGRHCFRPAHLHLRARHPGHVELCTQIFMPGDPWLDSDCADSVKDSLVISALQPEATGTDGRRTYRATYDLLLAPEPVPAAG